MRKENQFQGLISAPQFVRTQQKGRFCSPNSKLNGQNTISENDGRFSSNTTERYRTRCSKGSIIHSNFKINQNSLAKQPKNKDTKKKHNQDH